MGEWKSISEEPPPYYRNVLLAFKEHFNQVVGFRTGGHGKRKSDEYWETSAHDHNSKIEKPGPDWWMDVDEVPHYPRTRTPLPAAPKEGK